MIASTIGLALAALPVALGVNIFNVQVGAGGNLTYDPEFITADPGDIVNFIFNPKNHTVTQSSFDTPCVAAPGGFTSGFVPVAAGTSASSLPVLSVTVPEGTAPLWFYCQQTGHCGKGMVFAINPPAPPSPNSFSAFQALAIAQNGTASSSTTTTTTSPSTFTTPPAPVWTSATATVTFGGSVYTTTYSSYAGTPPPTPAANPVDHQITVGDGGLLSYNPANITANIGDTVTFQFHPKNHTVTQSSFLNPCQSLQETTGTAGFKSGFQPVAANATTFPTFQIKINDTSPIWGYCGQTGHCEAGMVFAINAVESGPNNFEAFVQLAKLSNSSASNTASGSGTGTGTSGSAKSTNGAISPRVGSTVAFGLAFFGLAAFML